MASPTPRRRATRIGAALIAVALVGGVVLQACGSDGSSSSSTDTTAAEGTTTTTVVNTSSLDDVTVEGEPGAKPTVTFDPSFAADGDVVRVISTGDGPVVEEGQLVTFDYVTVDGATGAETDASYGMSRPTVLLSTEQILPIVPQAMVGQPVGSRILAGTDQAGQVPGAWTLFLFEITAASTPLDGPSGEPVTPPAGLPTVVDTDGTPAVTMPGGDAPTSLVVQPLVTGDGAVVEAGQTIVVNYVGAVWSTGTVFDSSFDRGAPVDFVIGQQQVIAGWDEGLVGQTVGSRMLLVIPPDKGYGPEGNPDAGISGTDTLVFVVDILAAG